MAMNKAEKAEMCALQEQLAFRWPTIAEPDRTVRANGAGEAVGWDFNAYNRETCRYWTTETTHGCFYEGRKTGGSQGGRTLYASEFEAMIAMRWALCRQFASILHIVDQRISERTA